MRGLLELARRRRRGGHRSRPAVGECDPGENRCAISLVLRGRHLEEPGAEAGQFFRWRVSSSPATWRTAHPFSLSALPRGDARRITVKSLGDGSRRLQSIGPGTLVVPEGPSGAMTADRWTRPSVLLVAGGVGITPMRALLESLDVGPGRLTLLYRVSAAGRRGVPRRARGDRSAADRVDGGPVLGSCIGQHRVEPPPARPRRRRVGRLPLRVGGARPRDALSAPPGRRPPALQQHKRPHHRGCACP